MKFGGEGGSAEIWDRVADGEGGEGKRRRLIKEERVWDYASVNVVYFTSMSIKISHFID